MKDLLVPGELLGSTDAQVADWRSCLRRVVTSQRSVQGGKFFVDFNLTTGDSDARRRRSSSRSGQ